MTITFGVLLTGCKGLGTPGAGTDPTATAGFVKAPAFQPLKPSGVGSATALIIANFTNDSYPDIVLMTQSSGTILYKNTDGTVYASPEQLSISSTGFSAGASISSGFIAAEQGTGTLKKILNTSGVLTQDSAFSFAGGVTPSLAASFDGTRTYVFAFVDPGTPYITEVQAASFSAATVQANLAGRSGKVLSVSLNSDSYPDFMAVPSTGADTIRIYRGRSLAEPILVDGTPVARTTATDIIDFDLAQFVGTTASDLMIMTAAGFELYRNVSTTSEFLFASNALAVSLTATGTKFVSADFVNQEGKMDLLIANETSGASLFKQREDSLSFEDVTATAFEGAQGSGAIQIYAADVNGDSYVDIVELFADGSIEIFINNLKTL